MKGKLKKLYILLSPILILVLSVVAYQHIQNVQEESRDWELFLNHFYGSLDRSITHIDYLLEQNPENEDLNEGIHDLEVYLVRSDEVLNHSQMFLNGKILDSNFFQSSARIIQPIVEDNVINDKEAEALNELRSKMADAKQEMYSEETGQENPELELEAFNEIVLTFFKLNGGYHIFKGVYPE